MNASRLPVQPRLFTQIGTFWILILAIYYACLLLLARQDAGPGNVKFLIIATGFGMAATGWGCGRSLADGLRVLGAGSMPRALWKSWLRIGLQNVFARWALAVCAGTVALSLNDATWHWSAAAFLFSAILTLSFCTSLAHHGVWHWAWSAGIAACLATAIAVFGWHGLEQLLRLPARWQLSLALCWPLLAAYVAWSWRERPPRGVGRRKRAQWRVAARIAGHANRYTGLDASAWRTQSTTHQRTGIFAVCALIIYLCTVRIFYAKTQWGQEAGLVYLGTLILIFISAHAMLVCRDLHWRRLLAPNGFPRGRLGWHIIASTLTAATAAALGLILCCGLVLLFVGPRLIDLDFAFLLRTLQANAALPVEFVLAVCVGTVIRGTRRPKVTAALLLLALAGAVTGAILVLGRKAALGLFVIGPGYIACVLVAIAVAVLIANRVWTTQRLLQYVLVGATEANDRVTAGRWFPWPGRPYFMDRS